jgi:hypothetical protein
MLSLTLVFYKLLLLQKVSNWYQNQKISHNARKPHRSTQDGRFSTSWNVRRLVQELMDKDISKLMAEKHPEFPPGSHGYLSKYPACWTEMVNGLSEEKRTELEALADKWNQEGPGENVKPR